MEGQQDQDLGNKNNSSSYLCRQSSTRWTPTSDQIRILKELYYNNGIRSPTADQIQRIAARLRQYGKIEGKNVFYWFQNHKARERQKKRFTPAPPPPPPPPPSTATTLLPSPFSDHHHAAAAAMHYHTQPVPHIYNQHNKLCTTHHIPSPGVGSSSQGVMTVGCGYGSVAMEKSFRECSISQGENKGTGFGSWVGVESYSFLDKMKPYEEEEELGDPSSEIETLPLFPIHGGGGGNHHDFFTMKAAAVDSSSEHGTGGYYHRASLELSLNSYGYYN